MVASACASSAVQTGRTGGAPQPPSNPASPSSSAPSAGGAPSGAPIKIGASVSITGSNGRTGQYQQEAYQLWERQVNARGGLLGRPV